MVSTIGSRFSLFAGGFFADANGYPIASAGFNKVLVDFLEILAILTMDWRVYWRFWWATLRGGRSYLRVPFDVVFISVFVIAVAFVGCGCSLPFFQGFSQRSSANQRLVSPFERSLCRDSRPILGHFLAYSNLSLKVSRVMVGLVTFLAAVSASLRIFEIIVTGARFSDVVFPEECGNVATSYREGLP